MDEFVVDARMVLTIETNKGSYTNVFSMEHGEYASVDEMLDAVNSWVEGLL